MHVVIIGGGIGGLTLAQSLRKQGISFDVYERDAHANVRSPGWAIGLHSVLPDLLASVPDDLPSIQETSHLVPLPLPAQICFYAKPEDPDPAAERYGVQDDGSGKVLRAKRESLLKWLRTGVTVHYGKTCVGVEEKADGTVVAQFSDGTSASGDVIVGADGGSSAVRQHLAPDSKLRRIPAGLIVGQTTLAGKQLEDFLNLGHSSYVTMHREPEKPEDDINFFAGLYEVYPDKKPLAASVYWWLGFRDEAAATPGYWTDTAGAQEMLEAARRRVARLGPKLRAVVDLTPVEGIMTPPTLVRDLELESLPVGRITLLGDAAHCMAPFRGEGGVQAMKDALNLGRALGKLQAAGADADWKSTLSEYQEEMLKRGLMSVQLSRAVWLDDNYRSLPRFSWGHPAGPLPPGNVSLDNI